MVNIFDYLMTLQTAKNAQHKEKSWGKIKYEPLLARGIEAYIWLGRYLLNIYYGLDEDYIREKIDVLYQLKGSSYWKAFMEGYVMCGCFNSHVYPLMRKHYIEAVSNPFSAEGVDDHLAQHIALAYLTGKESLGKYNSNNEKSLFWQMLLEADTLEKRKRWIEVAKYFWGLTGRTISEDKTGELKNKILAFWEWAYNEKDRNKEILQESCSVFWVQLTRLINLVDKIDAKTASWISWGISYIELGDLFWLMQGFSQYEDTDSLNHIGKLFLGILQKQLTPTYPKEVIKLIVERLYGLGKENREIKQIADEICNTYGRRGEPLLRPLFDANK